MNVLKGVLMSKPEKPEGMNGNAAHLWGAIWHLNGRIDKIYVMLFTIMVGTIGTLVAVLWK